MKQINKKFTVEITKEGAHKGQPAIWYCEHPMKRFVVEKSIEYKGVYQVADGEYKGMIIDPPSCKIVKT